MSARTAILAAIRAARPEPASLPEIPSFADEADGSLVDRFTIVLAAAGGTVMDGRGRDLTDLLAGPFPSAVVTALSPAHLPASRPLAPDASVADLAKVDLLVVEALLGVAENGAVWLSDPSPRAAPFLAQHVAVVLPADRIVADLHEAYAALGPAGSFGVFVAGPSKTADIEQALVVGAHGPRSLVVVLV
jgi:L-lactate dehydrogenase complex protein LldG